MRRFWFLFVLPIWSNTLSCVEALPHLQDMDEGRARIAEVRAEVDETGTWPFVEWWTDKEDSFLDFASRPWVSAARGSGDCEDAMVLARVILQSYETLRVYVETSRGWHAALLWHTPAGWVVISNMVLLPWIAATAAGVAAMIFGSDTLDMIIF